MEIIPLVTLKLDSQLIRVVKCTVSFRMLISFYIIGSIFTLVNILHVETVWPYCKLQESKMVDEMDFCKMTDLYCKTNLDVRTLKAQLCKYSYISYFRRAKTCWLHSIVYTKFANLSFYILLLSFTHSHSWNSERRDNYCSQTKMDYLWHSNY